MTFRLDDLIRKNIQKLKPYSSARSEFKGEAKTFLDANENSLGSPLPVNYNRYPDPLQWQLKFAITKIKGVPAENIFIGNGSDEVIDLAYRIFCTPTIDNVIICPPTYGMYEVCANINDVEVRKVSLLNNFQLDIEGILNNTDKHTKLLFICSPNNPTGNSINRHDIEILLNNFNGLVIIDEAYINFAKQQSFIQELIEYPNLLVMQTLSKAWGLASLRLGLAFASMDIINLFNKVKPPYNINEVSQKLGLEALGNKDVVNKRIKEIVEQRIVLSSEMSKLPFVKQVFDSDANFILVKMNGANNVYDYLLTKGVVVRNRSHEVLCDDCLRITIGSHNENIQLLELLKEWQL